MLFGMVFKFLLWEKDFLQKRTKYIQIWNLNDWKYKSNASYGTGLSEYIMQITKLKWEILILKTMIQSIKPFEMHRVTIIKLFWKLDSDEIHVHKPCIANSTGDFILTFYPRAIDNKKLQQRPRTPNDGPGQVTRQRFQTFDGCQHKCPFGLIFNFYNFVCVYVNFINAS